MMPSCMRYCFLPGRCSIRDHAIVMPSIAQYRQRREDDWCILAFGNSISCTTCIIRLLVWSYLCCLFCDLFDLSVSRNWSEVLLSYESHPDVLSNSAIFPLTNICISVASLYLLLRICRLAHGLNIMMHPTIEPSAYIQLSTP